MDKRRQSILKQEGRMPLQEMLLPDFPDDDTATTTVTKSRRVSFGANFVKEFIVGSAVSTQFFSEYEQAFSSSDSSNPNSSRSGILDQSTFLNEDALNLCVKPKADVDFLPVRKFNSDKQCNPCNGNNERTKEKNWDFNVGNMSNIFMEKGNNLGKQMRANDESMRNTTKCIKKGTHINDSFSIGEKQMRNRHNDSELNSSKINESTDKKCKQGKFSSTICFSADSPTADMEFTEGCISLAKSILDKKKKEMTVYIQAKTKENPEDKSMSKDVVFDGSGFEMSLTKCVHEESETDSFAENENSFPFPTALNESDDFDNSIEESKSVPEYVYPLSAILGRTRPEEDAEIEKSLFCPERSLTDILNSHSERTSGSDEFSLDDNEECDMEISSCEPLKIYTYDDNKENLMEEEKENIGPAKVGARKSDEELAPFPEIKRVKKNTELESPVRETSSLRRSPNGFLDSPSVEKVLGDGKMEISSDCEKFLLSEKDLGDGKMEISSECEKEMSFCDSENFENNYEKFNPEISCDSWKVSISEKKNLEFEDMDENDGNELSTAGFPGAEVNDERTWRMEDNDENFAESEKGGSDNEPVGIEPCNQPEEDKKFSPTIKNETFHAPTVDVNMKLEDEAPAKSEIKSLANSQPVNLLPVEEHEEEGQNGREISSSELLRTFTIDKGSNDECDAGEEEKNDAPAEPENLSRTEENEECEMEMSCESFKKFNFDAQNVAEEEEENMTPVEKNDAPDESKNHSRIEENETEMPYESFKRFKFNTGESFEEEENLVSGQSIGDVEEEKVEENLEVCPLIRNDSPHSSAGSVNTELREEARGESQRTNNCQSVNVLVAEGNETGEEGHEIEISNGELLRTFTIDKGSNEECDKRVETEDDDAQEELQNLSRPEDNEECDMEMASESFKIFKFDTEKEEDIMPAEKDDACEDPGNLTGKTVGSDEEKILTGARTEESEMSAGVDPVSVREENSFTGDGMEIHEDDQMETKKNCNEGNLSVNENRCEDSRMDITNCETWDRMSQTKTFCEGREMEEKEEEEEEAGGEKMTIEENEFKTPETNSFLNFSSNEEEPEAPKGITCNFSPGSFSEAPKPVEQFVPEPKEGFDETGTEYQMEEHPEISSSPCGIPSKDEDKNGECDVEMSEGFSEILRNDDLTREEHEEVNSESRMDLTGDDLRDLPECREEEVSGIKGGEPINSPPRPAKCSDSENEGNTRNGKGDENGFVNESKTKKNNCISKGDKKIMSMLTEQEQEINSSWKIDSFTRDGGCHSWSFSFSLLGNPSVIKFKLVPPMEMSIVSFSSISEGSITLLEATEYQSRNKKMVIDFGFKKVKNYFEGESRSLDNVHKVPLFLDRMNVYLIRINNILNQFLRIMKEYPGSRLTKSVLSFRLYSFPLMFSLSIMVDVSDPLKLSESSISFEKHFGDFSPAKIKSVFASCLKREEVIVEFIRTLVQSVINEEIELGCVTNRSHIRLII